MNATVAPTSSCSPGSTANPTKELPSSCVEPSSSYSSSLYAVYQPESDMDDLEFLHHVEAPEDIASLTITTPDGRQTTIKPIDLRLLQDKCIILHVCFQDSAAGRKQFSVEALSTTAWICFLRHLYTGDYKRGTSAPPTSFGHQIAHENYPLALNAEIRRLANDFDVTGLADAAYCDIFYTFEMSCSMPTPPLGLCDFIRYVYEGASDRKTLVDTVLDYCVGNFTNHKLSERTDFSQVLFQLPAFQRDLCRKNYERGFDSDGAASIIQLPSSGLTSLSSRRREEQKALGDFLFDIFGTDSVEANNPLYKKPIKLTRPGHAFTLVRRPKRAFHGDFYISETESLSADDTGFSLVHRPKARRLSNTQGDSETEVSLTESSSEVESEAEMNASTSTIKPPTAAASEAKKPMFQPEPPSRLPLKLLGQPYGKTPALAISGTARPPGSAIQSDNASTTSPVQDWSGPNRWRPLSPARIHDPSFSPDGSASNPPTPFSTELLREISERIRQNRAAGSTQFQNSPQPIHDDYRAQLEHVAEPNRKRTSKAQAQFAQSSPIGMRPDGSKITMFSKTEPLDDVLTGWKPPNPRDARSITRLSISRDVTPPSSRRGGSQEDIKDGKIDETEGQEGLIEAVRPYSRSTGWVRPGMSEGRGSEKPKDSKEGESGGESRRFTVSEADKTQEDAGKTPANDENDDVDNDSGWSFV
ncbi:hypothetical protein LTS18_010156 [Coniosporium uncinatum]|uniref:Uncharacterized protein n=1 Tax=Coniosporium uncinatum TaxID=93489 RepID=A0ACC3DA16_9PEZI|nr:hypothetical protein LTS18_010156 [Coniosporium uncinatum]